MRKSSYVAKATKDYYRTCDCKNAKFISATVTHNGNNPSILPHQFQASTHASSTHENLLVSNYPQNL